MKKIIIIHCCLKKLLPFLFLLGLLFGGGSIFGANKNIYAVIATKVDSNIKTTFKVYAINKEEAAEEVALNGWDVIEVKLIKKYDESIDKNLKIKISERDKTNKENIQFNNSDNESDFKSKYLLITYFDFAKDSTVLKKEDIETLKKMKPDSIYYVYGHTDSVPVKPHSKYKNNYDLSLKRAEFIKRQMIKLAGIPAENIKIVGLGEFYPAVSNSLKGEMKNRRVEVYEKVK